MIVTEEAGRYLAEALDRAGAPLDAAVRVERGTEAWIMRIDVPGPDDETFDHEGRTVLVLDPDVAEELEGTTLEIQRTGEGAKLTLNRD